MKNNEFNFVDTDLHILKKNLVTAYENIIGEKIESGDPMSDFIDYTTFIVTLMLEKINETGKQNLLRYSTGENLDELGFLIDEERGQEKPAITTIKYTFSKSFNTVITISKGHKTEVNGLYFATENDADLKIGDREINISCKCTLNGIVGNGIATGEIKTIVDPIPYLEKVTNITESDGGAETESDETLRERIRTNPSSKSVAGPESAYIYHTKRAHHDISDVYVFTTPGTGIVNIIPLLNKGIVPTTEILALVKDFLNNKEIKPLTDIVNCIAPSIENYSIDVSYYIYSEDFFQSEKIKLEVTEAIEEYIDWQSKKLGRDINPDQLRRVILNAGAKRCEIRSPSYSVIGRDRVPKNISKSIIYGGSENE